jgi:tetratricopeptide (TPR) repeat protein
MEKAAALNHDAAALAHQGNIEGAEELWNKSLSLQDQMGDLPGKASTLHEMAGIFAEQGNLAKAMELWRQSLQIYEPIGDVKGKAATLANMAWAAGEQGQADRALELNKEAATLLASIQAWPALVVVLANMGGVFLLQALWLGLRVPKDADDLLALGHSVFREWTPESDAAPLLAMTLHFLVIHRYETHPRKEEFSHFTLSLLGACAQSREIPLPEFEKWMRSERLFEPDYFLPALDAALNKAIPADAWLFDTAIFAAEER